MIYNFVVNVFNKPELVRPTDGSHFHVFESVPLYLDYPQNEHHWTTEYACTQAAPLMLTTMGMNWSSSYFRKVDYHSQDGKHDLSYYTFDRQCIISCKSLFTGRELHGADMECLFGGAKSIPTTDYHQIFCGAHSCCVLDNQAALTNKVLILNTDSESIPLIRVLLAYYRTIYYMDNRTHTSLKHHLKPFWFSDPTQVDFAALMLDINWIAGKLQQNYR